MTDLLTTDPDRFDDNKIEACCRYCRGRDIYLNKDNGIIYCEYCQCSDCGGQLDENDECQWLNAFLGKYEDWENKYILDDDL